MRMRRRRRRRVEHGDASRLRHPLGEPRTPGRRRRRRRGQRWQRWRRRRRALAVLSAGGRRRQLALGLERIDAGLIAGELRVCLHRVGDHVVDLFLLVLGHAPKGDPESVVALKLPQALASGERHQDFFFTISAASAASLPTVSPAGKPFTGELSVANFCNAGASDALPVWESAMTAVIRASATREPSACNSAGCAGGPSFSINLTSRSSTSTFL